MTVEEAVKILNERNYWTYGAFLEHYVENGVPVPYVSNGGGGGDFESLDAWAAVAIAEAFVNGDAERPVEWEGRTALETKITEQQAKAEARKQRAKERYHANKERYKANREARLARKADLANVPGSESLDDLLRRIRSWQPSRAVHPSGEITVLS